MADQQDCRSSLRSILNDPVEETPVKASTAPPEEDTLSKGDPDEDGKDAETPRYTSTTQTTRRNANGSVSSVYSGNKIKHLKKEDGVPLWRKDIQYEFLELVFDNEERVFTRYSDKTKGHTFADIYIDAMAKSSKTSKILKEKLAQDRSSAVSMAMVCLLVNVGRMNTTLNFFPEMRAQLRTYHSIPALQAHQDPNAYKQLQDAPRLKSILKGASEDEPQPGTIDEIKNAAVPRTNPVNLIFVLAQYAPKISEVHFTPPRDFFDLVMRPTLSSKSRATAFLWLIWWYLESDFSQEDSQRNPFGPGLEGEHTGGMGVKVPQLEVLMEEQAALENMDTPDEKLFGEIKRKERISIVASEPSPAMTALKRARKERSLQTGFSYMPSENEGSYTPSRDFQSPAPQSSVYSNTHRDYASSERTRSPTPPPPAFQPVNLAPKPPAMSTGTVLSIEDTPSRATPPVIALEKKKGPGRGNWRRNKDKAPVHHEPQPILPNTAHYTFIQGSPSHSASFTSFPAGLSPEAQVHPRASDMHIPTPSHQSAKRSRPLTQHQVAISEYRRTRVQNILDRGARRTQTSALRKREQEGALLRAWKRIRLLPSGWDSEEEEARVTKDGGEKREDVAATIDSKIAEDAPPVVATPAAKGGKGAKNNSADAALPKHRPLGGVWMAGFVLPGLRETDDAGEAFAHYARVMGFAGERFEGMDKGIQGLITAPRFVKRVIPVPDIIDEGDPVAEVGERPRLVRRTGPGRGRGRGRGKMGRGRGGKNEAGETGGGGDVDGEGDTALDYEDNEGDGDGEGEDMDVDVEGEGEGADGEGEGELDEEDRELLGEVDADESGDEDDEGDGIGDEDGMDDT